MQSQRAAAVVLDTAVSVLERLRLALLVRRLLPLRLRMWVRERRGSGTLVPVDELRHWYGSALDLLVERRAGKTLGDYLEFGVFQGDSLGSMYEALTGRRLDDVRLFGFDSFEGLPPINHPEDRKLRWHEGDYAASERKTAERLERQGVDMSRVCLVKGWYSETLIPELAERHKIQKASVVMIDCDLYTSAKQALDFCAPLIEDDAVVFFDDWEVGAGLGDKWLGEKKAFDEFLSENPDLKAEEIGTYYHTEVEPPVPAKVFLVSRSARGSTAVD